jgi:hypothetical protein
MCIISRHGFCGSTIACVACNMQFSTCISLSINTTTIPKSPSTLYQPSGYSHQPAEFGFTQCPFSYKHKNCELQGSLIPIPIPICNDDDLIQAQKFLLQQRQQAPSSSSSSLILLVERGNCSFPTTVRLVQSLEGGVEGLIFADHTCLCSSTTACPATTDNPCAFTPPILTNDSDNDSNNNNLYLPTVLMQKQDAQAIHAFFYTASTTTAAHQTQPVGVTVNLTWPVVVNTADLVTIDYFHVPGPYRLDHFGAMMPSLSVVAMAAMLESLSPQVAYTPHFAIVSGHAIGCHPDDIDSTQIQTVEDTSASNGVISVCDDMCTNKGRYCAQDPETSPFLGVSGASMVRESLIRMCIWKLYGRNENDFIGVQFWKYVTSFDKTCTKDSFSTLENSYNDMWMNSDDACSIAAISEAGMSSEEVFRCVVENGDVWDDNDNSMLEEALREVESIGGTNPPMLIVNSIKYRGQSFSESFGAICASFNTGSVPEVCATCGDCSDDYHCLVKGGECHNEAVAIAPTDATIDAANNHDTAPGNSVVNDQEVSEPTALPGGTNQDMPTQSPVANDNESEGGGGGGGGGISDSTKLVIVVAVVGGAIVCIFAVVMVLVCKLLGRIRLLEKKEKETPTTTSPSGSNAWELPYYVVPYDSNDPFGDCKPVPNIAQKDVPGQAAQTADSIVSTPFVGFASTSDVVPRNTTKEEPKGVHSRADPFVEDAEETGSRISLANDSTVHKLASDTEKAPRSAFNDNDIGRTCPTDKVARASKVNVPPERAKAKRRKSKQDPILIDIMGKAAPEAKVTRNFSSENEEKEEIVEQIVDE